MKKIWVRCNILLSNPRGLSMLLIQAPTTTLLILSRKISNRGMKTGVSKLNQMLLKCNNLDISQIQMDFQEIVNFKKVYLIIKIREIQAHLNSVMTTTMLMKTPTRWTGVSSRKELGKMWLHTNLLNSHLLMVFAKITNLQGQLNLIRILFNHNLAERIQVWIITIQIHFRVNQLPNIHKTMSNSTTSRSVNHQTIEQGPTINTETVTKEFSRRKLDHQLLLQMKQESPLNSNKFTTKRYNRLLMKLPRECISTRRSMSASWKNWEINITTNRPERRWKSAHLVLKFPSKIKMELEDQNRAPSRSITSQETKINSRRRSKIGLMSNLLSRIDTWRSREAKDWWVQTVEKLCKKNKSEIQICLNCTKREWATKLAYNLLFATELIETLLTRLPPPTGLKLQVDLTLHSWAEVPALILLMWIIPGCSLQRLMRILGGLVQEPKEAKPSRCSTIKLRSIKDTSTRFNIRLRTKSCKTPRNRFLKTSTTSLTPLWSKTSSKSTTVWLRVTSNRTCLLTYWMLLKDCTLSTKIS